MAGPALAQKPLAIGPLELDVPVVLAPMAGITNTAFRRLCREYGAGLYVSEMITSRALVERTPTSMRLIKHHESETPRSIQLYGVEPTTISEAIRFLVDEDRCDHIDLNFGCPVPKVTRKGGGAALPWKRSLFRDIVESAVKAAGDIPVTIKMRKGIDDNHLTFLEAGKAAEGAGVASIALHARTASQFYSGHADWDAIGELKSKISGVPVLGNGDIWEAADAVRMIAETGCDGVVIGRGCLGRPWLFGDLVEALAGRPVPPSRSLGDVCEVMVEHARLLVAHLGENHAMRDFRKHTGWYMSGYPVGSEVRRRFSMVGTLLELDDIVAGLDPNAQIVDGGERIKRGHTNGPIKVSLPDGWLDGRRRDELLDDTTVPDDDHVMSLSGG